MLWEQRGKCLYRSAWTKDKTWLAAKLVCFIVWRIEQNIWMSVYFPVLLILSYAFVLLNIFPSVSEWVKSLLMLKLLTTIPLEDNILYRMLTAAVPDQTWLRAMWRLMREKYGRREENGRHYRTRQMNSKHFRKLKRGSGWWKDGYWVMQDGRDGEKVVKDKMEQRHRNKGKQLFLAVKSDMGGY